MTAPINGFVHIIESPSPGDLLDGRTEGRALSEALRLADIPHCYNLATNKESLRGALGERLVQAWKHFNQPPILHLSMHGNTEGVALTSEEFISWHDLRGELLPLLEAMQGALLITMSACGGGAAFRMAMYDDDKVPFWALVGNAADVVWSDAAVAYIAFFHLFFKGRTVEACVEGMRSASGNPTFLVISGKRTRDNWIANNRKKNFRSALEKLGRLAEGGGLGTSSNPGTARTA